MNYIVVRTYGNGKFMNMVYPVWFKYLSQAERMCEELNSLDEKDGSSDKWIVMPVFQYLGSV